MEQIKATKKNRTLILIETAICTSIIAVLSQISVPFIGGIPMTLQTLAVALIGFILGKKNGTISMIVYILLGVVGIPVFAQLSSGMGVLFGVTGGYIFGFIGMVFLCGLSEDFEKYLTKIFLSLAGLIVCHICGVLQFAYVSKSSIINAFTIASLPYILKDILSIIIAFWVSKLIKTALLKQGIRF